MSLDDIRNVYSDDINQTRISLLSDYLLFTRAMYQVKNGREFKLSQPVSNESHFLTVARALTDVFEGKTKRLYIGLPPGWGKSELCKFFIAWCFAHYGDCKFLYISYAHELASMHTHSIRETLKMPIMKKLFGIEIKQDSSAKDFFSTTEGGVVKAFGSKGGITGFDSGLPGIDRFSGCTIIDDIHKPDEVHSDTIRDSIGRNYDETIVMRCRSPNIPIVIIGQRLHEDDLIGRLLNGPNKEEWKTVIIQGIDVAGNARYPEVNPLSQLIKMRENQPYVFASQVQQEPMPSGGALFKRDWFPILDEEPKIIATFITADTAESEKQYADSTVFSFWGLYQVEFNGEKIKDLYALHWLNCRELKIEPKDLEPEFLDFYTECMRYKVKPEFAAIEKKSSGVTLVSLLKKVPGIKIIDINRNGFDQNKLNSKSNRFLAMQPFIAEKRITLPSNMKHTDRVIDHMIKITPNNTHRHDDICDTAYDAIKMALIDKIAINRHQSETNYDDVAKQMMSSHNRIEQIRRNIW